jgi:hypothetical protein
MCDLLKAQQRKVNYRESDHFGFMSLFFLSKQLTHAISLLRLGECRDVVLIARTMFEGYFYHRWVQRDPATRALQWRAFVLVHDWRKLRGMTPDHLDQGEYDRRWKETVERLAEPENRDVLLTPQARKCLANGQPLPDDPYIKKWPDIQMREILEEAEAIAGVGQIYTDLYKALSGYHHWESPSMTRSLRREESGVRYSGTNPEEEAIAYVCAIASLGETAVTANNQYGMLPQDELEKIQAEARSFSNRNRPGKASDRDRP